MKEQIFSLTIFFIFSSTVQESFISKVWVADKGSGTYKTSMMHADYSNADIVRVGYNYCLTASSFTCSPNLPILHSKNLVNWQLVNCELSKQISLTVFNQSEFGKGVGHRSKVFIKGHTISTIQT